MKMSKRVIEALMSVTRENMTLEMKVLVLEPRLQVAFEDIERIRSELDGILEGRKLWEVSYNKQIYETIKLKAEVSYLIKLIRVSGKTKPQLVKLLKAKKNKAK